MAKSRRLVEGTVLAVGMTPAQASGIGNGLGHDKWLGLIRKAQNKDEKDVRENKQLQTLKDQWKKMGWID